jgi:putative ABC transport system substrate-binding protein
VNRWPIVVVVFLLMISGLMTRGVSHAGRSGPFRIGVLTEGWGPPPQVVGMRDGLVEMGYREDKDFVIGVRFTQGDSTALPAAARELVDYGVDLIFVTTDEPAKVAQRVTNDIPIVFAGVADPVGSGLIERFARPGGNITGVTNMELNLGPKRLEIFKATVPGLKRVLFPYNAAEAYALRMASTYRNAARRLGIELIERPVGTQAEAQTTLANLRNGDVDGFLVPWSTALNIIGLILETEARQSIPAMYSSSFFLKQGGFASYGSNAFETGRQAARLVAKIIKGAKPAEIPVEVNAKIELVINLKTAKKLGLTVPPELLYQADRLLR